MSFANLVDGPLFSVLGPSKYYALFNDSLSVICGSGLDSNPQATITWTAPDGTTITNSARHHPESGPDVVRLNFTYTTMSDDGIWNCNIHVISERDIIIDGNIIRGDAASIGVPIQHNIQLTVIGE